MPARSFLIAWLLASPAGVAFPPPAEQARPQSAAAPKPASDRIDSLSKETPVQRTLNAGERHRFQITLQKNQLVVVNVDQIGIDVVMSLSRPNGTKLTEADSPNGRQGSEQLPWVAREGGRYLLEVRSLEANAPSGRYELRIATQRAATPRDATVAAASAAYGEALLSGPAKTVEASRTLVEKFERAAALFHDAEESGREADVCQSLGDAHVRAGDDKKAIEWFEREARLRHDRGDQTAAKGPH